MLVLADSGYALKEQIVIHFENINSNERVDKGCLQIFSNISIQERELRLRGHSVSGKGDLEFLNLPYNSTAFPKL